MYIAVTEPTLSQRRERTGHPVWEQSREPGLADAFPGGVEGFWQDAGFADDGDEVSVADPARQGVHMDVAGDASTTRLAEVDADVEAGRIVDLAEDLFDSLGEGDHLLRLDGGKGCERVNVTIGDDEDVACGVGVCVEAEEAGWFSCEDVSGLLRNLDRCAVRDGVIDGCDHVAEDAVAGILSGFGAGGEAGPGIERGGNAGAGGVFDAADIVVAPRGPETIHGAKYTACGEWDVSCTVADARTQ